MFEVGSLPASTSVNSGQRRHEHGPRRQLQSHCDTFSVSSSIYPSFEKCYQTMAFTMLDVPAFNPSGFDWPGPYVYSTIVVYNDTLVEKVSILSGCSSRGYSQHWASFAAMNCCSSLDPVTVGVPCFRKLCAYMSCVPECSNLMHVKIKMRGSPCRMSRSCGPVSPRRDLAACLGSWSGDGSLRL